jgi:hypothetical protein
MNILTEIIKNNPQNALNRIVDLADNFISRNINFGREKLSDIN